MARLGRSRPASAYIIIKRQTFAAAPAGPPVSKNLFVTFMSQQHPRRRGWHMTSVAPPAPVVVAAGRSYAVIF